MYMYSVIIAIIKGLLLDIFVLCSIVNFFNSA